MGRGLLLNGQLAQAMLRSDGAVVRPHLEISDQEKVIGVSDFDLRCERDMSSVFGYWRASTVLCSCGNLVRLDRETVQRHRAMGKPVECRQCRNRRIAREREELERDFYGPEEP
jgi:hypothetical protein